LNGKRGYLGSLSKEGTMVPGLVPNSTAHVVYKQHIHIGVSPDFLRGIIFYHFNFFEIGSYYKSHALYRWGLYI